MTALALRHLSVTLEGNDVLAEVSLGVPSGGWLGVIGPNGAGKSTLLRAVAGTVAYRGVISADLSDVSSLDRRSRARMIALVPQRPMIPPESTVLDYVNLGRTPHLSYLAVEGAADVAAVWSAISRLDLESLAHRRLGSLSGGEMQRAVLARALAQEPSILLLDEPTAALDLGHQQQVLGLVEELRRTGNLTVVSALHDLTMAARFCDQLVLLNGGRVMALGAAGDVLTEESIRRHYGADVRVLTLDEGGVAVIPIGPLGATAGKAMRV